MKQSAFILACIAMLSLLSCNKEKIQPPFSATGYWKGTWYLFSTTLLVLDNGTSIMYVRVPNGDTTASVVVKAPGMHTVTGDNFKGEYNVNGLTVWLESTKSDIELIEGTAISSNGEAMPFKFTKQP